MRYFIAVTLLVGGVIHLLPLVGVLGTDRLASLYGVSIDEPNLAILLRHRAVLFGLIGGLMVAAVFKPALQPVAFAFGLLSVSSFLYLARTAGGYNSLLSRVVAADILALVCLLAGAAAYAYTQREG
jgi:hypothetical protein